MKNRRTFLIGFIGAATVLPTVLSSSSIANDYAPAKPTLYTTSNATAGNQLLAFEQMRDGSLKAVATVPTGGTGTGAGLGNQGAIAVTRDREMLLTVNAGSNEVSVFNVEGKTPKLVSKVSSGGVRPVSVAIQGDIVYVVNAGSDDVTGFYLRGNKLQPMPNSRRALSATGTAPAQVSFTPDSRFVVVTEKATNTISTFPLRYNGYLGDRISNPSNARTPFGFAFDRKGRLLVSEANGGAPNGSSVSSYKLPGNGVLQTITASAKTNQSAACWVVVSKNGEYAYASNTGSGSLSGFKIEPTGMLKPLTADGRTGDTGAGSGPLDMIFSRNGRFLSALSSRTGTIVTFEMLDGGGLKSVSSLGSLPTTSTGLAVR
jgi:6-phosphogluconolactonase